MSDKLFLLLVSMFCNMGVALLFDGRLKKILPVLLGSALEA